MRFSIKTLGATVCGVALTACNYTHSPSTPKAQPQTQPPKTEQPKPAVLPSNAKLNFPDVAQSVDWGTGTSNLNYTNQQTIKGGSSVQDFCNSLNANDLNTVRGLVYRTPIEETNSDPNNLLGSLICAKGKDSYFEPL